MKIEYKNINDINPYENNPRNNENAVEDVARSIKEYGFKVPIVIDKDGVIVTGHTRVKAAQKLGMSEVPCIVADDLTPEQIKEFRLVDNKVNELAAWDFEKLEDELKGLSNSMKMEDFGFDLSFDDFDLDAFFKPAPAPGTPTVEPPSRVEPVEDISVETPIEALETDESYSYIDDLMTEDFAKEPNLSDHDEFEMSFSFPIEHRGLLREYVKEVGKNTVVDMILNEAQKWQAS